MAEMKPVEEMILEVSPYYKKKKGPEAEHKLVYDSSSETLEPIYFFLLDLMNESFGLSVEKLYDNFTASPGSGHFGELNQRMTIMQQQGAKIMGDVFMVLKAILNIIYDLKEFRIRLQSYQQLKDKVHGDSARLSLKQIWMDKVDIQKGNSSIKGMALGQAGFATLLDAFLAAKDEKDVKNIDLNERVKRIVEQRIAEFNIWVVESEQELKKRYEIQRNYLKSQVSSLKLYSRWVKPYLKAAADLEQKDSGRNPALVKAFNTVVLETVLFGKGRGIQELIPQYSREGTLPKNFRNLKLKRNYFPCVLVSFTFRGIPQKVGQHVLFGGRAEVTFRGYSLNEDEIKKLNQDISKSDIGDLMKLVSDISGESLEEIQKEIDFFLDDKKAAAEIKESKEKETPSSYDVNPFLALIGWYDRKKEEKKEDKKKDDPTKEIIVAPDSWLEKEHIRSMVAKDAAGITFNLMNVYKKVHGMPNFDPQ